MVESTSFVWNAEALPRKKRGLQGVADTPHDEFLCADAITELRAGRVNAEGLHLLPFSGLRIPLLCAVRDHAYRNGTFSEEESEENASLEVRTRCVGWLNKCHTEEDSEDGEEIALHRQLVLYSLIAPQTVLLTLFKWMIRQTLLVRLQSGCRILSQMGSLVAYRETLLEPGLLCRFLQNEFTTGQKAPHELSRLCRVLTHLMETKNAIGLALVSPLSALRFLALPILEQGEPLVALDVVKVMSDSMRTSSILFQEAEIVEVTTVVERLMAICGFENRKHGRILLVQTAMKILEGLIPCCSELLLNRVLTKCEETAPWPVLHRIRKETARGKEHIVACFQGVGKVLQRCTSDSGRLSLKGCEAVIIAAAFVCDSSSDGKLLRSQLDSISSAPQSKDMALSRETWLTALMRELAVFSEEELVRLLKFGLPIFLPPFNDRTACNMAWSGDPCDDCEELRSRCNCLQYGLRALFLLLKTGMSISQQQFDTGAAHRTAKAVCSGLVELTEAEDVPSSILALLLSDLASLAAAFSADDINRLRQRSSFEDILADAFLNIWLRVSERMLEREGDMATSLVAETVAGLQRQKHSSPLCQRFCDQLLDKQC